MGRASALASGVVRRVRSEGGGKGNGSCMVGKRCVLEAARLASWVREKRYRGIVVCVYEMRVL